MPYSNPVARRVILEPYSGMCHTCEATPTVLARWYGFLLIPMLAGVVVYVLAVWIAAKGGSSSVKYVSKWFALPQGATLKRWVACSAVISFHYQTIILVGSVRPYWPTSVQRALACMALDYSCFTETACMRQSVDGVYQAGLAANLDAQSQANSLLLMLMLGPPLMIIFNATLKLIMQFFRRKELERGMTEHDSGCLAFLNRAVNFIFHYMADYIPNIEFMCSVLMVIMLAHSVKVGKQLIVWSGTFGAIFGTVLIALQPTVWMLYGRDAAIAQRDRKSSVLHESGIPKDQFRVSYLTEPFKEKAASWQLLILIQQFLIFFAAWAANYSQPAIQTTNGVTYALGHILIFIVLTVCWSAHSLIDPWDGAYLNAASSRLYLAEMVQLLGGLGWHNYYMDPVTGRFFNICLDLAIIVAPLVTVVYLLVGLRATRCSTRLMEGVLKGTIPIWIRGMRWEELELTKGTVAIGSIQAKCPTSVTIHEALSKSSGASGLPTGQNEIRRMADFAITFERLLKELAIGFSSSNLSAQVRKYGAKATLNAQLDSLKFAKRRMKKELRAFGIDTRKPKQYKPDGSEMTDSDEEFLNAEEARDQELAREAAKKEDALREQMAKSEAARLAKEQAREAKEAKEEAAREAKEAAAGGSAEKPAPADEESADAENGAGVGVVGAPASLEPVTEAEADEAVEQADGDADADADAPAPAADSGEGEVEAVEQADGDADADADAPAPAADSGEGEVEADANAPSPDDSAAVESPPPSPPSPPPSPPGDEGGGLSRGLSRAGSRSGLSQGTSLQRGASAATGLVDGSMLMRGESRAGLAAGTVAADGHQPASLGEGTALESGQSSATALGAGTVLAGGSEPASLADGTLLTRGESRATALADGTVLADGRLPAPLGAGTSLESGRSSSTALASGTLLTGGRKRVTIGEGTVLTRGESGMPGLADGTSLTRGDSTATPLAPKGLVLGNKHEYYGAAALHKRVKRFEATGQWDDDVASIGQRDPEFNALTEMTKGRRKKPKMERSLSEKQVKKKVQHGKPTLERTPIEPPHIPTRDTSADTPTTATARHSFFLSNVEWLVSPAQDVSQAKGEVSAWPREANYGEPGQKQLDSQMVAVLDILQRTNFGDEDNTASSTIVKPLVELGYTVRLCLHQHRDARTLATRAALIRQRFFLQVVDWRTIAENTERFLVIPNEYLGQWSGRRLRVREPRFSGGPAARGSDALVTLCREGKAVVYDSAFTSVLTLPSGVRAKVIHHSIEVDPKGQTYGADHPWGDMGQLWRALFSSSAEKVGKGTKIFDKKVGDVAPEPGCSAGILTDTFKDLIQDMSLDGGLELATPSRDLQLATVKAMREIATDICEVQTPFRQLVQLFPKVIWAGERGLSIHLCASEVRRLGPDPTREFTVWLTLVDLNVHNPIKPATGGTISKKRQPIDRRHPYLVKGEIPYLRTLDEMEADEKQVEEELEEEHKRLLTSRLGRARSKKASMEGASGRSASMLNTPADLERAASELAEAEAGARPEAAVDPEDEEDALQVQQLEEEARQLRERQLSSPPRSTSSGNVDQV